MIFALQPRLQKTILSVMDQGLQNLMVVDHEPESFGLGLLHIRSAAETSEDDSLGYGPGPSEFDVCGPRARLFWLGVAAYSKWDPR
jgi:hypothetical protein